ncbi:hypothetical protein P4O66_018634 [Electrophorus voltai]|uniref:Uncharacterized protein n=1 Tax=Electrophorus voltai TaxID=2609070 RepID=A0AAD9DLI5_9TELE|nr:hypothetical protein P4O66_018634 [Electrophorus voltai]
MATGLAEVSAWEAHLRNSFMNGLRDEIRKEDKEAEAMVEDESMEEEEEEVDLQDEPLENYDLVLSVDEKPRDREAAGRVRLQVNLPAEADGPLHDLKSGDWVVIKDLRRNRWFS